MLYPIVLLALATSGLALPGNPAFPDGQNHVIRDSTSSIQSRDVSSTFHPESDDIDLCGESSFIQEGGDLPNVEDCRGIIKSSRSYKGRWDFTSSQSGNWHWMAQAGNCVFRAKTDNKFPIGVGNTDVADLVSDAIEKFANEGKVGASGQMGCKGNFDTASVQWSLHQI